jgi:PAS domain S-box-containing protein
MAIFEREEPGSSAGTPGTPPRAVRAAFLAEASRLLASSLDYETTLESVARLAVPHVADWCFIDLVDPSGEVRRVAVVHSDPSKARVAEVIRRHPPRSNTGNAATRTLATGRSILIPDVSEEVLIDSALNPEHLTAMRSAGTRSKITVALRARERTLGVVTFLTAESGRRFTTDDLAMAEELARHAALAVDNAMLFAAERAARERAERAVLRSARVQTLTAALSGALTRAKVADVILEQALPALGASAGAIALRVPETGMLEIIGTLGFDRNALDPRQPVPMEAELPITDAIRGGAPVFLESQEMRRTRYPRVLAGALRIDGAWAALPLLVGTRAIGGMSISFERSRGFDDDDRSFMLTRAGQCAQALERARLFDAERMARAEAVAGEARYRVLADIIPQIVWIMRQDGSLEYMNRRFFEYTGWHDEVDDDVWTSVIHPDHVAPSIARWREVRTTGETFEQEYLLRRSDGAYRWHLGRSVPVRGDDGAIL